MDRHDTDATGNLWGACTLAFHDDSRQDIWLIPEVCVYFNRKILRGTHLVKEDASGMDAFDTPRTHLLGSYTSDCTFDMDLHLIGYICHKRLYVVHFSLIFQARRWSNIKSTV